MSEKRVVCQIQYSFSFGESCYCILTVTCLRCKLAVYCCLLLHRNGFWPNGGPKGYEEWGTQTTSSAKNLSLSAPKLTSQLRGKEQQQLVPSVDEDELHTKLTNVDLGGSDHPGSFANSKGQVLLDTHVYHMFTDVLRLLPAVRHIGRVCLFDASWLNECCQQHVKPTKLKRMVGEWTAAFDQLPSWGLEEREATIEPMSEERAMFLKHFVYAQIATYESQVGEGALTQTVQGWFFWNFKMELEVYREWDYLKGLERGWIPKLPTDNDNTGTAGDLFGSCEYQRQVILANDDKMKNVVDAFPDKKYWPQWADLPNDDDARHPEPEQPEPQPRGNNFIQKAGVVLLLVAMVGGVVVLGARWQRQDLRGYSPIPSHNLHEKEISIPKFAGTDSSGSDTD